MINRIIFAASASLVLLGAAPAQAQTAECTCQSPAGPSFVQSVSGNVNLSSPGASALVPVTLPGTPIPVGGQLITGIDGAAVIQVGLQCNISVPASSEVLVSSVGNDLCAQLEGETAALLDVPPPAPPAPPAPPPSGAVVVVGIGAAAGIAYAISETGDEGEGPASSM